MGRFVLHRQASIIDGWLSLAQGLRQFGWVQGVLPLPSAAAK